MLLWLFGGLMAGERFVTYLEAVVTIDVTIGAGFPAAEKPRGGKESHTQVAVVKRKGTRGGCLWKQAGGEEKTSRARAAPYSGVNHGLPRATQGWIELYDQWWESWLPRAPENSSSVSWPVILLRRCRKNAAEPAPSCSSRYGDPMRVHALPPSSFFVRFSPRACCLFVGHWWSFLCYLLRHRSRFRVIRRRSRSPECSKIVGGARSWAGTTKRSRFPFRSVVWCHRSFRLVSWRVFFWNEWICQDKYVHRFSWKNLSRRATVTSRTPARPVPASSFNEIPTTRDVTRFLFARYVRAQSTFSRTFYLRRRLTNATDHG